MTSIESIFIATKYLKEIQTLRGEALLLNERLNEAEEREQSLQRRLDSSERVITMLLARVQQLQDEMGLGEA